MVLFGRHVPVDFNEGQELLLHKGNVLIVPEKIGGGVHIDDMDIGEVPLDEVVDQECRALKKGKITKLSDACF